MHVLFELAANWPLEKMVHSWKRQSAVRMNRLIGSSDTLVIDGRFSSAPVFVQALARLRAATRVFINNDDNGVARGALRLVKGSESDTTVLERVPPLPIDLADYRHRWRESAEASNRMI